ncbi:uncharacterized protein E0L32_000603 [Thyridium curvatum]|uniref:Pt repeat family protein n=1 Tax=Thyridium curvatum TaxID=1093900 RepID=A0A507B9Z7_9PEZI|nr:uncharacterized protein E0L32_000603 [Thyridium curvatum]TPX14209.1 hypothetical protein E0L32_000603 [Thyridium curvatum]
MGWHFSFRRRRNKNKGSSSNGKSTPAQAAPVASPVTAPPQHQQQELLQRSRSNTKETSSTPLQVTKDNAPPQTCPLVVTASIRFPDSGVGSLYSREYRSSPDFDPTERICRGLLRRIEYGSEELITRKDSSALDPNGQHSSKPLRYEMHFKIVRHGDDVWAERTFKSYQKHPVFYHAATELAAATHRLIGLYLHEHDTGFKWTGDPLRDYLDEPEVSKPSFEGPLSLNSVPRARFLESTQSFEFVPGFTIEIAFRSRSQQRAQQDWKRTSRLSSKQGTPLNLGCAEDLLYRGSKAVNEEYEKIKQAFDARHKDCEMLEGAVGCHHFEQDALEIDLRIFNNLGPDFDHLRRSIRTRLALFCDEDGADCERFLRALQARLSESRDRADEQLSQMEDFDFRILKLSGHSWQAKNAARFTFDSSVSRSRRTIEATLDRVQTGVIDVLRGNNVAAHLGAYKRGHHILDKALIARSSADAPSTETDEDPEAQKVELISRLEARIQEDLEMICKDTCSLADIPDDKPLRDEVSKEMSEDVPDVVEVPVTELSAVESPAEPVAEMPTPPATPPTEPRSFPLVPLKYRPEIPVRTSSASSHFSGILGVPGTVQASREGEGLAAPESPVDPDFTWGPGQKPDGAPVLTRDFGADNSGLDADGQVLRRKSSIPDLKAGVEGSGQGENLVDAAQERRDVEPSAGPSVPAGTQEISETQPAESAAVDVARESSPSAIVSPSSDTDERQTDEHLAEETAQDAQVNSQSPALSELTAEVPQESNTETPTPELEPPTTEPVVAVEHETAAPEDLREVTQETAGTEQKSPLEADLSGNGNPDSANKIIIGQEEVPEGDGTAQTAVTEATTEAPVVEQAIPAVEELESAEPPVEPKELPLADGPGESTHNGELDNADGADTLHAEADVPAADPADISPLPLLESVNGPSPSAEPVTVEQAGTKDDADSEESKDVDSSLSKQEIEDKKPATKSAEESGEVECPQAKIDNEVALLAMPEEAESPPQPDLPVSNEAASAFDDSSDDRDRPQTPPDIRETDTTEDPTTPLSKEADNESLAPSTPGLSCGDDMSPEASFLATPVLHRSAIIQGMPALVDQRLFDDGHAEKHEPESAAKSITDVQTPELDKGLLDQFPSPGPFSATEQVHFVSGVQEPEFPPAAPSASAEKRSVKLWRPEDVCEPVFEDDFSRTKSDYAFDHDADLFSPSDDEESTAQNEVLPGRGDSAASDAKDEVHVRDGRHSATPEPPARRMSDAEAACHTDGAEGVESHECDVKMSDSSADDKITPILVHENADLSQLDVVDEAPPISEPAEPDTSEDPVDAAADEELSQLPIPEIAEEVIELEVKQQQSPANLPADVPAATSPTPSDPELPESTVADPSGPDNNNNNTTTSTDPTDVPISFPVQDQAPPTPAELVTRTLTAKSSASSGWEDCSSAYTAPTHPRDSVDSVDPLDDADADADEAEDSLPPLHATTGYVGLHEGRLVEFGLRGALTGSRRFDAALRPSTAPSLTAAAREEEEGAASSTAGSSRTLRLRRRARSVAAVAGVKHGKRGNGNGSGNNARRAGTTAADKANGERDGRARRSASLPPAATTADDETREVQAEEAVLPRVMRMFSGFRGRR